MLSNCPWSSPGQVYLSPKKAFAKEEDGDLRPYMEGVSIPHMEAEIGLLIGS